MREGRLILLGLPDQLVRTNGFELVELGDQDLDVEVVAQVDPGEDEDAEVGADKRVVDVV